MEEKYGTVLNIQGFSIHDGPGIRTTMFLKGCPLRCPWCSNPESIHPAVQIRIVQEKCRNCGRCVDACRYGALTREGGKVSFQRSFCTDCLSCAEVCEHGCILKTGTRISAGEAVEKLLRDRPFYENTQGGVTISGGEPLFQPEFTAEVLSLLHGQGVHTALDTSGFASLDALLPVIDYTDLVLFDIKHIDRDRHLNTIGVDNEIILANLEECSNRSRIWTRTPLIPGFNDDAETMDAIVDLARKVGAERCCFLPLHRWGEQKYSRLGLSNPYENLGELSAGNITIWKERYRCCAQFVSFETA